MQIDTVTPYIEIDQRIKALNRYEFSIGELYQIACDVESDDLQEAVIDLEDRFALFEESLIAERKKIEEGEAAYIELYQRRMKGDWS